ncbi:MAG: calcium-binding protein [Cyanobacteria bacterium]|nr:calcium-binding protein [Cyanobacteriota bacterium]MDA0867801.1 calcium-binding protein [Cyanobacteriota bacterium]
MAYDSHESQAIRPFRADRLTALHQPLGENKDAMLTELQNRKLLKLFCMYDGDRDGFLVCQDFEKIASKLATIKNLGSRSPKFMMLRERMVKAWKNLLKQADASGDKKISLEEWLAYHDEVLSDRATYTAEVQAVMELIFDMFDTDGNGTICAQEWAELFQVYNIHPAYAPSTFKQLDANQDGCLSKDEVLALIDEFFCGDNAGAIANAMFGPY